jgi:hypothetical protein
MRHWKLDEGFFSRVFSPDRLGIPEQAEPFVCPTNAYATLIGL